MEQRPLAHIRACRYPHVVELFAALKRRNKIIGIFSDYPGRRETPRDGSEGGYYRIRN